MSAFWIEIARETGTQRHALGAGRTRLGGPGCDIDLGAPRGEELHLWTDPPKAVFVGAGEAPRMGGEAFQEAILGDGDRIDWLDARIRVTIDSPVLVEEPEHPPAPTPPEVTHHVHEPSEVGSQPSAAWERLRAGLLVELGLADRGAARRWQEAVGAGSFDPDACARDILRATSVGDGDARLLERAGRLQRDLLMAPLQRGVRGGGRRVRAAARQGAAFLIAQAVAIGVYSLLILAALLITRAGSGTSIDALLDRMLELVGLSGGGA